MLSLQKAWMLLLILVPSLSFAQELPIDAWDFFQMLKKGSGSITPRGSPRASPRGSPRASPRNTTVFRSSDAFARAVDVEPGYLAEMQIVRDTAEAGSDDFTVTLITMGATGEVTTVSFDETFQDVYQSRATSDFFHPRVDPVMDTRGPSPSSAQWRVSYDEFRNFMRAACSNERLKAKKGSEGRLMLLVPVQTGLHMVFQEVGTSPPTPVAVPVTAPTKEAPLRMVETNLSEH